MYYSLLKFSYITLYVLYHRLTDFMTDFGHDFIDHDDECCMADWFYDDRDDNDSKSWLTESRLAQNTLTWLEHNNKTNHIIVHYRYSKL